MRMIQKSAPPFAPRNRREGGYDTAGEDDVAHHWWALPSGCILPLSNGDAYQMLFAGRLGGSAGPDVRDAVFRTCSTGMRVVGDVEFHVHSSDWGIHNHQTDARYNNVILHVVLLCDNPLPTLCQDRTIVPVCSLADLPLPTALPFIANTTQEEWPCHTVMQQLNEEERIALFKRAGLLRFEQKTYSFVEQLRAVVANGVYDAYDTCLIPSLAEGLGYGRDRDFFRAAGLYLVGCMSSVPEPLGRSLQPSPLDGMRLHVLHRLVEQWRVPGVWNALRSLLLPDSQCTQEQILQALREAFCNLRNPPSVKVEGGGMDRLQHIRRTISAQHGYSPEEDTLKTIHPTPLSPKRMQAHLGISLARTDILLCNVVLPFAAAVALIEHHTLLGQRAEEVYMLHPGLPSNRITRMMSTQLQLTTEPRGSCQQQGLHYIYRQACQEKYCDRCIAGRNVL